MLSAEVKEGEILPPTIQRLMKGYNKYLRPFFDSKEAACAFERNRCRFFFVMFVFQMSLSFAIISVIM